MRPPETACLPACLPACVPVCVAGAMLCVCSGLSLTAADLMVRSRSELKCAKLGRKPFTRLVGACSDILQRNQDLYENINSQLGGEGATDKKDELAAENESLRSEVADLQSENERLKARVAELEA